MAKTMHRVALLVEPGLFEIRGKAAPCSAVGEAAALSVKEVHLFLVPYREPALQGEEGVVGEVDDPACIVLLPRNEVHLLLPEVDIVHGETEGLADPHACA